MLWNDKLLIGKGDEEAYILPEMANRHGLIAGATGTGKTVTLKVLAESFSDAGVPVFLADIKGDLAGCAAPGAASSALNARLEKLGIPEEKFLYQDYPVRFWDVYGEEGHPVRTTVSEMGSELLARLLGLTEIQTGVLSIAFRVADDKGWLLIDLKDLRAMIAYVAEHAEEFRYTYGNVARQSAGAIQRALLRLEEAGGDVFFGEPDVQLTDWMQNEPGGRGYINILHCPRLVQSPLLYSTFMLWMLAELFEELPEAGDSEKPKLVFFFDEAHLLFDGAPKVLTDKVEQVVKLIRSKGVGVYFITQRPSDIPDAVLAQLGNRVQHALRAYTPAELRSVRAAARSFRENPAFNTETAILELGTGEAIVSFLDEKGRPSIAQRATILPPQSQMGTLDDSRRQTLLRADALFGKYERLIDRESAYEIITEQQQAQEEEKKKEAEQRALEKERESAARVKRSSGSRKKSPASRAADAAMTSIGREIGKSIGRGLMGTLKKLF